MARTHLLNKRDIEEVAKLIRRMKGNPTWPKVAEYLGKHGYPMSYKTPQKYPALVAVYKEKKQAWRESGESRVNKKMARRINTKVIKEDYENILATHRAKIEELFETLRRYSVPDVPERLGSRPLQQPLED